MIDKSLKYPHPHSKSVDHIIDLEDGGSLLDLHNLGPAHLGCNSRAGRIAQWQRMRARGTKQRTRTTPRVHVSAHDVGDAHAHAHDDDAHQHDHASHHASNMSMSMRVIENEDP
jgi:hypothetical protein